MICRKFWIRLNVLFFRPKLECSPPSPPSLGGTRMELAPLLNYQVSLPNQAEEKISKSPRIGGFRGLYKIQN